MKKKPNHFFHLLGILFIVFIGLYIASKSGYYESSLNDKVVLTDKQIAKFEEDVINGEVLDLNSYILEERKDYANKFTMAGDKFTELVEEFINNGLKGAYKVIKALFL